MPHRPAASKSLKQDQKRNARNKAVKSRLRTEENRFNRMVERGDRDAAAKQLALLTKLLQKAAVKNVVLQNQAARQQARLQRQLNEMASG